MENSRKLHSQGVLWKEWDYHNPYMPYNMIQQQHIKYTTIFL